MNPEEAISSLRQAAAFLTELGKFKQIGKIHKDIAEVGPSFLPSFFLSRSVVCIYVCGRSILGPPGACMH